MSTGRRTHRLPRRLDYTLIPAPLDLDLSVPLTPVKSPFPTVIVTPADPTCPTDFSFAFIAQEPKPTLRERAVDVLSAVAVKPQSAALAALPALPAVSTRARTYLFVFILLFVMASHLFAHQLATRRPHLHFAVSADEDVFDISAEDNRSGFFGLGAILSAARTDPKREFVVESEPAHSSL